MRSAVTISLVEQARGGPFVYWDDLSGAILSAADLGFDAVELFAPGPDAVHPDEVSSLLKASGLDMAAVGTGAGMVIHKLSLTDPDPGRRQRAVDFIRSMIDLGAKFSAPAIIGSMQGRWGGDVSKEQALQWLAEGLKTLAAHAADQGQPLIYEPLNRYETNLCNTLADGVRLIESADLKNVTLLADLFHMNIEETDLAAAIRDAGAHVGHVHFVDSTRRGIGSGHMDHAPIVAALKEMGYAGYLSAECFPLPDSDTAARQTIEGFRKYVGTA